MKFQERQYTRYDYEAPVIFKKKDKSIWVTAGILDVSLGGILMKNNDLPQLGEIVMIRLTNLFSGTLISLEGKVVRLVQPPRGPGAGIEFVMPSSNKNLLHLIDILKKNSGLVDKKKSGIKAGKNDPPKVMALCREIMDNAQYMNYYKTLGLSHDATFQEIIQRKKVLLDNLAVDVEKLDPAQTNLLQDTIALIKRLAGILANPPRRLSYNVTIGQVSHDFILDLKKHYEIDMQPYANFWDQKFPHKIEKAQKLLEKAHQLKQAGDTHYLEIYRQIWELAPFFNL